MVFLCKGDYPDLLYRLANIGTVRNILLFLHTILEDYTSDVYGYVYVLCYRHELALKHTVERDTIVLNCL